MIEITLAELAKKLNLNEDVTQDLISRHNRSLNLLGFYDLDGPHANENVAYVSAELRPLSRIEKEANDIESDFLLQLNRPGLLGHTSLHFKETGTDTYKLIGQEISDGYMLSDDFETRTIDFRTQTLSRFFYDANHAPQLEQIPHTITPLITQTAILNHTFAIAKSIKEAFTLQMVLRLAGDTEQIAAPRPS